MTLKNDRYRECRQGKFSRSFEDVVGANLPEKIKITVDLEGEAEQPVMQEFVLGFHPQVVTYIGLGQLLITI